MTAPSSKGRKIAAYPDVREANAQHKSNYHFVFSENILDWMYASSYVGERKKAKHKQHETIPDEG